MLQSEIDLTRNEAELQETRVRGVGTGGGGGVDAGAATCVFAPGSYGRRWRRPGVACKMRRYYTIRCHSYTASHAHRKSHVQDELAHQKGLLGQATAQCAAVRAAADQERAKLLGINEEMERDVQVPTALRGDQLRHCRAAQPTNRCYAMHPGEAAASHRAERVAETVRWRATHGR